MKERIKIPLGYSCSPPYQGGDIGEVVITRFLGFNGAIQITDWFKKPTPPQSSPW
jgi:hypothetical protein